ncbi:MAG: hypothetical protein KC503_20830 [Myxococcales bacterium]|nr:hypothetical protein [Myxococcales bacterium]
MSSSPSLATINTDGSGFGPLSGFEDARDARLVTMANYPQALGVSGALAQPLASAIALTRAGGRQRQLVLLGGSGEPPRVLLGVAHDCLLEVVHHAAGRVVSRCSLGEKLVVGSVDNVPFFDGRLARVVAMPGGEISSLIDISGDHAVVRALVQGQGATPARYLLDLRAPRALVPFPAPTLPNASGATLDAEQALARDSAAVALWVHGRRHTDGVRVAALYLLSPADPPRRISAVTPVSSHTGDIALSPDGRQIAYNIDDRVRLARSDGSAPVDFSDRFWIRDGLTAAFSLVGFATNDVLLLRASVAGKQGHLYAYDTARDEIFSLSRGGGAWHNIEDEANISEIWVDGDVVYFVSWESGRRVLWAYDLARDKRFIISRGVLAQPDAPRRMVRCASTLFFSSRDADSPDGIYQLHALDLTEPPRSLDVDATALARQLTTLSGLASRTLMNIQPTPACAHVAAINGEQSPSKHTIVFGPRDGPVVPIYEHPRNMRQLLVSDDGRVIVFRDARGVYALAPQPGATPQPITPPGGRRIETIVGFR